MCHIRFRLWAGCGLSFRSESLTYFLIISHCSCGTVCQGWDCFWREKTCVCVCHLVCVCVCVQPCVCVCVCVCAPTCALPRVVFKQQPSSGKACSVVMILPIENCSKPYGSDSIHLCYDVAYALKKHHGIFNQRALTVHSKRGHNSQA